MFNIKLRKRKDIEYLKDTDIFELGFKEIGVGKNTIMNFKKGNMTLKWDFHITKRIVTIKWGKSMRFFGVVETNKELEVIMKNINKYFGKNK